MNEEFARILGIDYGSVRIGLSISDPLRIIAQGLRTIPNDNSVFDEIAAVVKEYAVATVVVGNPLNLNGSESAKSVEVASFVQTLKEKIEVTVILLDERFTSVLAQQSLRSMGTTKKQRRNKGRIDEMASAILLQGYLDSHRR